MGFRHRIARTWPVTQAGIMACSAVDPPGASNRSGRLERSRGLRPSGSDIEMASGEPCVVFEVLGHVHEFPNKSRAEKARSRIGALAARWRRVAAKLLESRAWQGPSAFPCRDASGPPVGCKHGQPPPAERDYTRSCRHSAQGHTGLGPYSPQGRLVGRALVRHKKKGPHPRRSAAPPA